MTEPESYSVEFAKVAIADLDRIVAYLIEVGAPDTARTLIAEFGEKVATLENCPRRGSLPKEIDGTAVGEVRQLTLTPYRIFYRIIGSRVIVTLLADGRRDMMALLQQRRLMR